MKTNAFQSPAILQFSILLVSMLLAGCKSVEKPIAVDPAMAQASLWDAARSGDLAKLTQAIRNGADVNAIDLRTSQNGRRALNWAAWYDHADAITVLLQNGADINGVNLTGFTPIHHAAEAGSAAAARVLIEAGADVNLPSYGNENEAGETPFQRASREGHEIVARLLSEAGGK